jgi:hypothetical protein
MGLSLAGALPGFGVVVVGKMAGCPAGRGRDIHTSSVLLTALYRLQIDARVQDPEGVLVAEVEVCCLVVLL